MNGTTSAMNLNPFSYLGVRFSHLGRDSLTGVVLAAAVGTPGFVMGPDRPIYPPLALANGCGEIEDRMVEVGTTVRLGAGEMGEQLLPRL